MELEALEKKRLTDLRVYGRTVGVKSASSLKKAELIRNIGEILTGKTKPVFTKVGRKPMEFLDLAEASGYKKREKEGMALKFPEAIRFVNAVKALNITQEELRTFEKISRLLLTTLRELI